MILTTRRQTSSTVLQSQKSKESDHNIWISVSWNNTNKTTAEMIKNAHLFTQSIPFLQAISPRAIRQIKKLHLV